MLYIYIFNSYLYLYICDNKIISKMNLIIKRIPFMNNLVRNLQFKNIYQMAITDKLTERQQKKQQ